jgi:hypothetical protein
MQEEKAPLSKITIVRGTVFNGEPAAPGEVFDVDDHNRGAAGYLVRTGKAVEGEVEQKPEPEKTTKQIDPANLDQK